MARTRRKCRASCNQEGGAKEGMRQTGTNTARRSVVVAVTCIVPTLAVKGTNEN